MINYEELLEKAKQMTEYSYCPYSKFAVGACILFESGKAYGGCNVENASYGLSLCAERNAIFTAITDGVKKGDFKEINVMVSSGKIGMPCFVCRQMISELFDEDAIVRCYSTNGESKEYTVKELCPYPFGEDDLQ